MKKTQLAEWLHDIASHIEAESPLIRTVTLDDEVSETGETVRVVRITFNRPARAIPGEQLH
ncbi:hypothetical protein MUA04_02820 [Enterobacteriaceae bacterium H11S18]|uniref:hypothetical protein n=1 Tax=Dryocola clanedunensis TaxID=2925396 RepID=UPI0022F0FDE4|nr:hypothetical protein [Dryocola clanedunensis]MCT4709132.1 hypothetical protein [Dryocola clanedunensis]